MKDADRIAANCPRDVFTVNKKTLIVSDPESCILCRTCENEDIGGIGAVKVNADTTTFLFKFETDGSVDPATAVKYALDYLIAKFGDFETLLSESK